MHHNLNSQSCVPYGSTFCYFLQQNVTPGVMYYYVIHCEWGSSPPLNFTAMRSDQVSSLYYFISVTIFGLV